jgi:hypothetical protein
MSKSEHQTNDSVVGLLCSIVAAAGAVWIGVQNTIDPEWSSLLFMSRESGCTLAVQFNPLTFDSDVLREDVNKRLAKSNAEFANRRISVKTSALQDLHKRIVEIESELREILGQKKS